MTGVIIQKVMKKKNGKLTKITLYSHQELTFLFGHILFLPNIYNNDGCLLFFSSFSSIVSLSADRLRRGALTPIAYLSGNSFRTF